MDVPKRYAVVCGGDGNAALLLCAIDNWLGYVSTRRKITKNGSWWVVGTRAEITKELHISKRKYDTALKILRGLSLIETTAAYHGYNTTTSAFRVTEVAREALRRGSFGAASGQLQHYCTSQEVPVPHVESAQKPVGTLLAIESKLKKDLRLKSSKLAKTPELTGVSEGKPGEANMKKWSSQLHPGEAKAKSAADVVKEIQNQASKNPPIIPPEKLTVAHLEAVYRTAYLEFDPAYFHGSGWVGKTRGQAKHFIDKVGREHAVEILEYCVANWNGFCELAEVQFDRPKIGVLLSHASEAGTFWNKRSLKPKAMNKFKTSVDFK